MSILVITSRNVKKNMRITPSRLLKILNVICLSFFLRAENLNCNGRNNPGSAIAHSRAVPEHHISFHRKKTTQTFIQNMSCLHSSLAGSYTIYSLMHSHLISAFLFKMQFYLLRCKKKKTPSVQGDCWEKRSAEWFCHSCLQSVILCMLVPETGRGFLPVSFQVLFKTIPTWLGVSPGVI